MKLLMGNIMTSLKFTHSDGQELTMSTTCMYCHLFSVSLCVRYLITKMQPFNSLHEQVFRTLCKGLLSIELYSQPVVSFLYQMQQHSWKLCNKLFFFFHIRISVQNRKIKCTFFMELICYNLSFKSIVRLHCIYNGLCSSNYVLKS